MNDLPSAMISAAMMGFMLSCLAPMKNLPRGSFAVAFEVEIALVDARYFHDRRVVVCVGKHESTKFLIFVKIARNGDEAWAKFPRFGGGHGGVDAKSSRLVTGTGN